MIDDLTPKQRQKAIAEGRSYDRLPNYFTVEDVAAKITGIKISEFHLDPQKQIDATVAAYEKFGLDVVEAFLPAPGLFGNEMVFPDYSTPYIKAPVDLEWADLANIQLADAKTHPVFSEFWRVLDGLFERVGDEAQIGVLVCGPFTTAARAIGVQTFLKKLLTDPEYIHALLDKVTEVEIAAVNALAGYDIEFDIKEPVSSGSLIRAEHYREFAKPYQKRLFDAMTKVSGKAPQLHICGNTSRILQDMVETGAGMVSVDNAMDLEFVKKQIGGETAIVRNVKPTDTMLLGTTQDVENDLKSCIRKAWDSEKRYIPAFGCGLPIGTPIENLDALFGALRKYGKYPINPEIL